MKKLWLIDAGHGGMIKGTYTTAPNKMFKHINGEIAYEGVINRTLKNYLIEINKALGLSYVDVSASEEDLSLTSRVKYANLLHAEYKNCVYLSLHSNAGKGTGYEIFTSPGEDESDKHATLLMDKISKAFPVFKVRHDYTDGDIDKEALFYVLTATKCPSILFENLFFDNFLDFKYLSTPDYHKKLAGVISDYQLHVETIEL